MPAFGPETQQLALQLLDSILGIFLIGCLGYVLQKRDLLGERGREALSAVMLFVSYPCLAFHAMVTRVDPTEMAQNALTVLLGALILVIGCALGYVSVQATNLKGSKRATFVHLLATNNFVNLPLPIVIALWPTTGTASIFLMVLGAGATYWVVGIYPLVRGQHWLDKAKNMVNIPFLALIAGLTVALLGGKETMETTPVLKTVLGTTKMVGASMVPLALIFVGTMLASATSRTGRGTMLYYSALRLVVFPILFLPVILLTGLPRETCLVALLVAHMPASNTSTMIASRFGGDAELASAANLYTTPLALLSVPLLFPLLAQFLPADLPL